MSVCAVCGYQANEPFKFCSECGTAAAAGTPEQRQVVTAVNAHEIPARLLEPLSSGVNDLAVRITCTPPPPPQPEHGKGHGKGHGKHGNREGD